MALNCRFFTAYRIARDLRFSLAQIAPRRFYSLLPSAYHLDDVWRTRLDTPLMQQLRAEEFYVELRKRFEITKDASPLDVEIFANKASRNEEAKHLVEILEFFRTSNVTSVFREGMHHAFVRLFLELGNLDELLKILANKPKYGLFLDHFAASLLMDKFLQLKRPQDAVRIAIDQMLQEDFQSPVTRDLALHCCISFLTSGSPDWNLLASLVEPVVVPDTGEEIIVYVRNIKNPFFDDHFDTADPKHLFGKTLYMAGRAHNDLLGRSCQLIGLGLYEKWDKSAKLLQMCLEKGQEGTLLKESLEIFMDILKNTEKTPEGFPVKPSPFETQPIIPVVGGITPPAPVDLNALLRKAEEIGRSMSANKSLVDGSLPQLAEKQVKETIERNWQHDAEKQSALYASWTSSRETEVDRLMRKFQIEERLKELQTQRNALTAEEEVLFFFERKNEWEKLLTPTARQNMLDAEAADGSSYDYRIEDPQYAVQQIPEPSTYRFVRWWKRDQAAYDAKQKELDYHR
ncbi:uncharacterized protein LOC129583516 [Paramacrobiotus metropolitanus]|uniref:uncharacterized protein LOC129583516 n=1 Tax=Paramacrobiotus metropolitanus TaxID=2943436 RepID=UPI0024463F7B|nr:uncharacterized protein LOC129583516 [Paramacrobiotus metropolitanus]